MPELPKVDELEEFAVKARESDSLLTTEQILKKLLVNIEAYKLIDIENKKLRHQLLKNQEDIKKEYADKLKLLSIGIKEKERTASNVTKNIIEKYKVFIDQLKKKAMFEEQKNEHLTNKYKELLSITRKLHDDNKKLKSFVKSFPESIQKDVDHKIRRVSTELRTKQRVLEHSHKSLLKQHEEIKLELNKELSEEKRKTGFIAKKYKDLFKASLKLQQNYSALVDLNKNAMKKLEFMQTQSLANEAVLRNKTVIIQKGYEEKLKDLAKDLLSQEIDYRTKVESLNHDLTRYHDEIKQLKLKYYNREQELKEKIKEIFD